MILSIGLAIKMIAMYTVALGQFTGKLAGAQARLQLAVVNKNDSMVQQYTEQVTMYQTLIGFYKEWIEEWKNVIKDTRQLLKSLADLGRPSQ